MSYWGSNNGNVTLNMDIEVSVDDVLDSVDTDTLWGIVKDGWTTDEILEEIDDSDIEEYLSRNGFEVTPNEEANPYWIENYTNMTHDEKVALGIGLRFQMV